MSLDDITIFSPSHRANVYSHIHPELEQHLAAFAGNDNIQRVTPYKPKGFSLVEWLGRK